MVHYGLEAGAAETQMHPHTEVAKQHDHSLNCSVARSVFNVGLIHSPLQLKSVSEIPDLNRNVSFHPLTF